MPDNDHHRKRDPVRCPKPSCQGPSRVIESIPSRTGRRQRRECKVCKFRWSTFIVDVDPAIRKRLRTPLQRKKIP